MRQLTEEEAKAIFSKPLGKMSRARAILMRMQVGEIILLEHSDWTQRRNGPDRLIRLLRQAEKRDYTIDIAMDRSGWIIKRIK